VIAPHRTLAERRIGCQAAGMVQGRGRLVLLRHAKSAWPEGVGDFHRPLTKRGQRDAPAAGRWLRDHVADLDLVVCSPAMRARQTWELLAGELRTEPTVRHDARLYDDTPAALAVARELPENVRTALFIGHNPVLEDLVALLTGAAATLKTTTVAVLDSEDSWADIGPRWARLAAIDTPRGQ